MSKAAKCAVAAAGVIFGGWLTTTGVLILSGLLVLMFGLAVAYFLAVFGLTVQPFHVLWVVAGISALTLAWCGARVVSKGYIGDREESPFYLLFVFAMTSLIACSAAETSIPQIRSIPEISQHLPNDVHLGDQR